MTTLTQFFIKQLEAETAATRKCLERIPIDSFDWKPHEKSMKMGYLALLVADVPKWIAAIVEEGEVNFATWPKYTDRDMEKLVPYLDENLAAAKNALQNTSDEALDKETFMLKAGDQVLAQTTKMESVASSINHWVHHRGELVVYMRLNDILVPSIYGPSADDNTF